MDLPDASAQETVTSGQELNLKMHPTLDEKAAKVAGPEVRFDHRRAARTSNCRLHTKLKSRLNNGLQVHKAPRPSDSASASGAQGD
jgi:hypothetical protein